MVLFSSAVNWYAGAPVTVFWSLIANSFSAFCKVALKILFDCSCNRKIRQLL